MLSKSLAPLTTGKVSLKETSNNNIQARIFSVSEMGASVHPVFFIALPEVFYFCVI